MLNISYIITGMLAGVFGGFLGLGGGAVLVPALIYIYGLTQHEAQGTSLAIMIPPITLLAAMRYYHSGNVRLNMAIFIALGFAIGGLIGAHAVQYISAAVLRKIFAVILIFIALKMLFSNT